MYDGVPISVPDMPRSYIPVLFGLKMPEILLALAASGIVGGVVAAFRSTIPVRRRAAILLVVFAALLPVGIAIDHAAGDV